jgi:hypothetical protein
MVCIRPYRLGVMVALAALCLGPLAPAQPRIEFGPKGEIKAVADGAAVYFSNVELRVVRPGWSANLASQVASKAEGLSVRRDGRRTIYSMTLQGEGAAFRLHQTVGRVPGGLEINYELTPDRDVVCETLMLQGLLPAGTHAGRTEWIVASSTLKRSRCPATLPDPYMLFGGKADWMAFAAPGARPLMLIPHGLSLQFQDDRQFGFPQFSLLCSAANGKLVGGKPVRFGITLALMERRQLEERIKQAMSGNVADVPTCDNRKLRISGVKLDRSSVPTFETVEAVVDLAATYKNPFDPDEIAVDAEITTPGGRKLNVPGFFSVPMRMDRTDNAERLRVTGQAGFRIRYAPTAAGMHRMVVIARDRTGTVRSKPITLTVTKGPSPGFVRVSKKNPAYFAHDSGAPFIAIGENLCWANGPQPLELYEAWLQGLGKSGANWVRLWLAYNEKGLEWTGPSSPRPGNGTYGGLGRYALDNAWRLDEIVRLARQSGVYLMFCLGTYGEFTEGGYFNEGMWAGNPYNKANGGPCATPADFWTDPAARKLYKQRLRYLIARYGHSPNVFAWEFWNEVPPTPANEKWVAEMAAFLKQNDPYRRLVSTTYGSEAVWKCPDVDFSMTHMYGQAGNTPLFTNQIVAHAAEHRPYGKPYLLAEFGIDWQTSDDRWDPKYIGTNMHNGAWAALMAGAAGTAMLWYWDSYVHPGSLYRVFTPIRKFADAVDWQRERLEPLSSIQVTNSPGRPETFKDLTVPGIVEWGMTPSDRYTILHDGSVQGGPIAMAIGSPDRSATRELHSKLTWMVDLERPTRVTLKLGQVCTRAHMVVKVNGRTMMERDLTSGEPGAGPWKASRKLEQYNVWISDYDEDLHLDLPAGPQEIEVANTGGDWFQIRSITLPAYQSSRYPDVTALGLAGEHCLLLWIHNKESNWRTDYDNKKPTILTGLRVLVPVKRNGVWNVEWWDTWTGEIIRRERLEARDGRLMLQPPPLDRDFAVRAVP